MDVVQTIDTARREMAAGNGKQAARLLTDAAFETHDPELERQIRELALEGRSSAGMFDKGRWDEIVRVTELRGANGQTNGQS
jgi:hypothetical protein